MKRVTDPADPQRCQAVTSIGQCMNVAVESCDNCAVHGGSTRKLEKASLDNYRLTKFAARTAELGQSTKIKSLHDEIAMLRVMLEEQWNECTDTSDLLLHSTAISEMVIRIEKLVASCNKLEGSMGDLLDKSSIIQFASTLIDIISDELSETPGSQELLTRISNRIASAIDSLGK